MRYPSICALALAALLAPAISGACGPTLVYFYEDFYDQAAYGDCSADLAPGSPLILHVLMESFQQPYAIRDLSFQVLDWIGNPGPPLGQVTEHWTADTVTGSLQDGITLTWEDGLEPFWSGWNYGNRKYELGYLEIEAFSPDWVGPAHTVRPSGLLYTDVEDWSYEGWDESQFTFNPTYNIGCYNGNWEWEYHCQARHFLPADGALVPPTFLLSFQAFCISCQGGGDRPYLGTVALEGEPIAEFEGDALQEFSIPVDASAYPPLSTIHVWIHVDFWVNMPHDYYLEYTLSDVTAARSVNLSALKASYR